MVAVGLSVVPGAFAVPREIAGETISDDGLRACPWGTTVVDVTQDVTNEADIGLAQNVWALENYTRRIVVVKVGPRSYCGATFYQGSFSTEEGWSPGLTSTVSDGLPGSFNGGYRTTVFTAKWRPVAPTSGWIGSYDYGCNAYAGCLWAGDWTTLYFTDLASYAIARYSYGYGAGTHGSWASRSLGDFGDITG